MSLCKELEKLTVLRESKVVRSYSTKVDVGNYEIVQSYKLSINHFLEIIQKLECITFKSFKSKGKHSSKNIDRF